MCEYFELELENLPLMLVSLAQKGTTERRRGKNKEESMGKRRGLFGNSIRITCVYCVEFSFSPLIFRFWFFFPSSCSLCSPSPRGGSDRYCGKIFFLRVSISFLLLVVPFYFLFFFEILLCCWLMLHGGWDIWTYPEHRGRLSFTLYICFFSWQHITSHTRSSCRSALARWVLMGTIK